MLIMCLPPITPTVTAPAHMRPFGVYSGYFTDPDGHLFEIAWDSNQ
jgi:catechol 2,3-dioxygenase-like lactoylglutathione lyase family enzyme